MLTRRLERCEPSLGHGDQECANVYDEINNMSVIASKIVLQCTPGDQRS